MKKKVGIIMVVTAALNMVAWIPDAAKGKSESPIYYIFIFMILGGGIWLISNAKSKKKSEKGIVKKDNND